MRLRLHLLLFAVLFFSCVSCSVGLSANCTKAVSFKVPISGSTFAPVSSYSVPTCTGVRPEISLIINGLRTSAWPDGSLLNVTVDIYATGSPNPVWPSILSLSVTRSTTVSTLSDSAFLSLCTLSNITGIEIRLTVASSPGIPAPLPSILSSAILVAAQLPIYVREASPVYVPVAAGDWSFQVLTASIPPGHVADLQLKLLALDPQLQLLPVLALGTSYCVKNTTLITGVKCSSPQCNYVLWTVPNVQFNSTVYLTFDKGAGSAQIFMVQNPHMSPQAWIAGMVLAIIAIALIGAGVLLFLRHDLGATLAWQNADYEPIK